MQIVPIEFDEACVFIKQHHRHHKPPQGHKFSIAVEHEEKIVGICIVGRPVGRGNQDGWTLEVTRLCTDGTKNACSILYSAAWRVTKNMGYRRLITYILETENGASLRASNWRYVGRRGGGTWSRVTRPRIDKHPTSVKTLFEIKS